MSIRPSHCHNQLGNQIDTYFMRDRYKIRILLFYVACFFSPVSNWLYGKVGIKIPKSLSIGLLISLARIIYLVSQLVYRAFGWVLIVRFDFILIFSKIFVNFIFSLSINPNQISIASVLNVFTVYASLEG